MKTIRTISIFAISIACWTQLAMAKNEMTTCYQLVTPSKIIINENFYNKDGNLNSKRSYRTPADAVMVKHIYSKEYNEDGSVSNEGYFLEINVRSPLKKYTTSRIPQMSDGTFAADEDGGSDIVLLEDQYISKLKLPRGAAVSSYETNKYGRKFLKSKVENHSVTLSESLESLTLTNVPCSYEKYSF